MKQSTALSILKTGQNVFLTGQAGAGKTYVLNQYIDYLRARMIPTAITASTGIAATHMNGMTIHSWSGIGIHKDIDKIDLKKLAKREDFVDRITKVQVLIIDEISMLHLRQVDAIDALLRHFRKNELPFGGVQVVFSGDFFQLPPIGEKGETSKEKYAFMSKAWLASNFQICYLTEQHRQAGQGERDKYGLSLNDILNQIRSQTVTQQAVDVLLATQKHDIDTNRTRLYTHNLDVDKINLQELEKLDAPALTFQAIAGGEKPLLETLSKSVRAPSELTLKVGAKVMFVKNMPLLGVYNGTMGEVLCFMGKSGKRYAETLTDDEPLYPVVRLNNGSEVLAEPESWSVEDSQGVVLADYTQIPLCLAWAITVHKSQGMTLDAAEIDLSKTFEMGQGYVALSRLRSLDGLQLLGFNTKSLLLDEWVQLIDRRFIELSGEHETAFGELGDEQQTQIHEAFVKAVGGLTDKDKIAAHEAIIAKRKQRQAKQIHSQSKAAAAKSTNGEKTDTHTQTRKLVEQGLSIDEIAKARSLAKSTIISHLDKLAKMDDVLDLSKYKPDDKTLNDIQAAYDTLEAQGEFVDGVKLRPIVDELREAYSYEAVRLALIFIDTREDE